MDTNLSDPNAAAGPDPAGQAAGTFQARATASMAAADGAVTGAGPAATAAPGGSERIDRFREDVAALELKTPADDKERVYLLAGVGCMVAGVVAILGAYWGASGTAIVAQQLPYLISGGGIGLALMIVGAALFVRFSLSRYLRFWLIREIYEQRVQTDRVVESLGNVETLLRAATRPRTKSD